MEINSVEIFLFFWTLFHEGITVSIAFIRIYSVKGAWQLDHSIQSKVKVMVFAMGSERDLISKRTKESLAAKKLAGIKLGQPTGPRKSKLD